MRVDILGLQAFVAIADLSGFQRAAGHLGITQTAVTRRLQKLEGAMGVQLLVRSPRRVSLTRAGSELLPQVRKLMADLAEAVDQTRMHLAAPPPVVIGCLPTLAFSYLPGVLAAFAARHDNVPIRVLDVSATEIRELVLQGHASFGVTVATADDWELTSEILLTEPMVLLCPERHRFVAAGTASWADLEGEPLVSIGPLSGNRLIVDAALGDRRDRLDWRYEVRHLATAVSLVTSGMTLAILPRLAVASHPIAGTCAVPLTEPDVERTLVLIQRRGEPLSAHAEAVRDLLAAQIRASASSSLKPRKGTLA